jgi:hypothetical protein
VSLPPSFLEIYTDFSCECIWNFVKKSVKLMFYLRFENCLAILYIFSKIDFVQQETFPPILLEDIVPKRVRLFLLPTLQLV